MAKSKKKTKVEPMEFDGDVTPIGVDASWTGLAVCALEAPDSVIESDGNGGTRHRPVWTVRLAEVLSTKLADFPSQPARMLELGGQFMRTVNRGRSRRVTPQVSDSLLMELAPALVAIEGYAMGAKYGREMAGELGGHLKLKLWLAGIPYIIVPPTSVKKYVLDKGVAPKELMMMTVLKRWGYEAPDNNACDAYCLARIAAEFAAGAWTKKFEKLAQGWECVTAKDGGA